MTEPPGKLPFWRTVIDAHTVTLHNLAALVRIGWPWALLLVLTSAALNWMIWPWEEAARTAGDFGTYGTFLPMLSALLIGALIAVPWHRLILTNTEVPPSHATRYLGPGIRYFLWLVALSIIAALPLWAIYLSGAFDGILSGMEAEAAPFEAALPEPGAETDADSEEAQPMGAGEMAILAVAILFAVLGPLAAISFIPTRLMLILPAVALEAQNFTPADSWRATRGNFWRLYLGSFAVLAAMFALFALYLALTGMELAETREAFVREAVILDLVSLVAGMVLVTFLSLAYRHLVMKAATTSADGGLAETGKNR